MPVVNLITNMAQDSFPTTPKEFNAKLARFLSELLKKPLQAMYVNVTYDANFTVDANFDPAAMLEIKNFECFGETNNIAFSKKIFTFLQENLGIKTERIVIHFNDVEAKDVGIRGTTAKEFLASYYISDQF